MVALEATMNLDEWKAMTVKSEKVVNFTHPFAAIKQPAKWKSSNLSNLARRLDRQNTALAQTLSPANFDSI